MVAISLYRGNLHRAPDIPRRWLMPTPKISLKDFKTLLHCRNKALSRLRSSSSSSNPNPNPDLKPQVQSPMPNGLPIVPKLKAQVESERPEDLKTGPPPVEVVGGSDGGACLMNPEDEQTEKDDNLQVGEKPAEETKRNVEVIEKVNDLNEKEKRKRVVEEKLQVLNAKKHNLVQVLRQILNVEEELKRRNSTQGTAIRPAVPLQVETTNDSGSMTRLVTSRMGSEANLAGENEGGEADDVSNLNIHSRHVFRMSSTSPSSESPLRRPSYFQQNVVPHPSRAIMGVTGSPSRFAPTGNQGHPGNPPAVSVSGTNYVASSPSPAASGGTSVFGEAWQPSPWN
ncbi:uncharacterized protein LOC111312229 [Durio zibethinus]|uniref:Uncharacterized protein LOC111312229 n=1 Tax=Durio zibethinus TaxID=66656 RepID=A0A6P6AT29_DURZI|nr:uncharacterized protein LOC111312229 [Durio zibethinus]XP_022768050.1 uncharacterized protein LOC111312229 [Durio zibethinus]XP_022768066.1 uncharacterized protein LOC111312229 [Durio zibethinus]